MKTIYVATIEHPQGIATIVGNTESARKKQILDWCKDWWRAECGDFPMPDDDENIIDKYFEYSGETIEYTETEIPVSDIEEIYASFIKEKGLENEFSEYSDNW